MSITPVEQQPEESEAVRLLRIRIEQQRQTRQREQLAAARIRSMNPGRFREITAAIERSGEAAWLQRG